MKCKMPISHYIHSKLVNFEDKQYRIAYLTLSNIQVSGYIHHDLTQHRAV